MINGTLTTEWDLITQEMVTHSHLQLQIMINGTLNIIMGLMLMIHGMLKMELMLTTNGKVKLTHIQLMLIYIINGI
jgi:hypothetical protein